MHQVVQKGEAIVAQVAHGERIEEGSECHPRREIEIVELIAPLPGELVGVRPRTPAKQAEDHQKQHCGMCLWKNHGSLPEREGYNARGVQVNRENGDRRRRAEIRRLAGRLAYPPQPGLAGAFRQRRTGVVIEPVAPVSVDMVDADLIRTAGDFAPERAGGNRAVQFRSIWSTQSSSARPEISRQNARAETVRSTSGAATRFR